MKHVLAIAATAALLTVATAVPASAHVTVVAPGAGARPTSTSSG